MIELFNKKYARCMPDKNLEGTEGFFGLNIESLKDLVNHNDRSQYYGSYAPQDCDFIKDGIIYTFYYYDPLYDYKVAYNEGRSVMYKSDTDKEFIIITSDDFNWDENYTYLIADPVSSGIEEVLKQYDIEEVLDALDENTVNSYVIDRVEIEDFMSAKSLLEIRAFVINWLHDNL